MKDNLVSMLTLVHDRLTLEDGTMVIDLFPDGYEERDALDFSKELDLLDKIMATMTGNHFQNRS